MNNLHSISQEVFSNGNSGLTLPLKRIDHASLAKLESCHSQLKKFEEVLIINGPGNAQIAIALMRFCQTHSLSIRTTSAVSAGVLTLASSRQSIPLDQISSISIHPIGSPTTSYRVSYSLSQSIFLDSMAVSGPMDHINGPLLRVITAIQCMCLVKEMIRTNAGLRASVNELWYPAQKLINAIYSNKVSIPLAIVDSYGISEHNIVSLFQEELGGDRQLADAVWQMMDFEKILNIINNQVQTNN